jgi:hypothetical protein
MVKRGPKILDGIREDERNGRGHLFIEAQFDRGLSCLRIAAKDKKIAVSLSKSFKSGLQIVDVMLGPL